MKRNIGYKLLALAIALVIWAYANEGQNPRISREIKLPLDVRKVDPGCVVTAAPKTVKVSLEGARTHVNSVAAEPDAITAYVNLHGKRAGKHTLPVIVRLPEGFTGLVSASSVPRKALITLQEKVQRVLAVGVQFIGSPPVGYRFGQPQVSPSQVIVSGTAERANRVTRLMVAVDVGASNADGINGEFSVVALDRYDKQVKDVELTPERIYLRLPLLEAPASRAVFVSVDIVGQPPFPHKVGGIDVYPQTVTVTGRPERLMNTTSVKTEPVYLANRTKTFSQRVRVIAPSGLTLADSGYVRVTVKIEAPPEPEEILPDEGD